MVGALALGVWGVVRGTWTSLSARIETDLGRLDIVQGLDGIPTYDELHARSTKAEILGIEGAVCSIQNLDAASR